MQVRQFYSSLSHPALTHHPAFDSSEQIRKTLSTIRTRLGTPAGSAIPVGFGLIGWVLDKTEASEDPRIPAVLDAQPAAIYFAFGDDLGPYVARVRAYEAEREHKTLVFVCVNTVQEALRAANEWKADVLVAQGVEAGGHGSSHAPSTALLVPAILAALPGGPPVVAAGGIATGAQAAAFLTLGAAGVLLGTRLLFTPECQYTPVQKSLLLDADLHATRRGMCFDEVNRTLGWPAQVDGHAIANGIWRDYEAGVPLAERQQRFDAAKASGDSERVLVWAGSAAGLVHEVKPAGDVVREVHDDAVRALEAARTLL